MSVQPKPYNPSQRIRRANFQPYPNLFSSADLNRQMEAFKSQIDSIHKPVESDLTCTFDYTKNVFVVSGSKIKALGSEWSINGDIEVAFPLIKFEGFIVMDVSYSEYTNVDGAINGVNVDGQLKAASNHLVYGDVSITSVSPDDLENNCDRYIPLFCIWQVSNIYVTRGYENISVPMFNPLGSCFDKVIYKTSISLGGNFTLDIASDLFNVRCFINGYGSFFRSGVEVRGKTIPDALFRFMFSADPMYKNYTSGTSGIEGKSFIAVNSISNDDNVKILQQYVHFDNAGSVKLVTKYSATGSSGNPEDLLNAALFQQSHSSGLTFTYYSNGSFTKRG